MTTTMVELRWTESGYRQDKERNNRQIENWTTTTKNKNWTECFYTRKYCIMYCALNIWPRTVSPFRVSFHILVCYFALFYILPLARSPTFCLSPSFLLAFVFTSSPYTVYEFFLLLKKIWWDRNINRAVYCWCVSSLAICTNDDKSKAKSFDNQSGCISAVCNSCIPEGRLVVCKRTKELACVFESLPMAQVIKTMIYTYIHI